MTQYGLIRSQPYAAPVRTLDYHDDDLDLIFERIRDAAERKRKRLPARLATNLHALLERFIPFRKN